VSDGELCELKQANRITSVTVIASLVWPTNSARGCFWEDDGQDDHDADEVRGGPNYSLSLTQARLNFSRIGAVEERVLRYVRPRTDSERPR